MIDNSFPKPTVSEPTCKTPGTVYETIIWSDRIQLIVDMPVNLLDADEPALIAELHSALLPVIEGVFRERWGRMAGRDIRGHDSPMPANWEEL